MNELEEAVRWYVEHVDAAEGTDFLTKGFAWSAEGEKHAKLLRKYRKDYDESRDDN